MPTDETPIRRTFCYLAHISVHEDIYALKKLAEVKSVCNLAMILTPGNHDQIHPKFQPAVQVEWTGAFQNVFDLISLNLQIKQVKKVYLFSHYPTLMNRTASRDAVRWAPHANHWIGIVHGHTYSSATLMPGRANVAPEVHDLQITHGSTLWDLLDQT